jgi:DNA-binding transcriptional LysR family regulator
MQQKMQRVVAKLQRLQTGLNINRLSWDDVRIFLTCADEQSFRKAAAKLGVTSSTVMRRTERLESALGSPLFNRLPEGLELTREGRSIIVEARAIEKAVFDLLRRRSGTNESLRGHIKISITEGLGSYWLIPRLVEFQRENPNLIIDVQCEMTSADVLRMEADISIQFKKPTAPDLITVKLGALHGYPFASREYINIYGKPTCIEEMVDHRIVDQAAPNVEGTWERLLNVENIEGIVGIRTNASTALFYAIEKGAGIGALPSYALALGAPLVPIDIGINNKLDIWLTYHPDTKNVPKNKLVIKWLKGIFNPVIYPWFRDEFIHPIKLIEMAPKNVSLCHVEGCFSATPFKVAK